MIFTGLFKVLLLATENNNGTVIYVYLCPESDQFFLNLKDLSGFLK